MPFSFADAIADLPEMMELVNAIVSLVESEKAAVTYVEKQKLSEPVQEKLAALIDKVIAQAAS